MIDSLKQYLLTVILAAIIIGIAQGILGKKSSFQSSLSLLCGLYMLLTVLAPFKTGGLWFDYSSFLDAVNMDAEYEAASGQLAAQTELESIITTQTETYICDKATEMGAQLDVSVETEAVNSLPMPVAVTLEGSISPYAKSKMKEIIKNDIGIPEEQQKWK